MALSEQEQQELAELEALEAQDSVQAEEQTLEEPVDSSGSWVQDAIQAVPGVIAEQGQLALQGAENAISGLATFARSTAETTTFGASRPASAWMNAKIEKSLYGGDDSELYQKYLDSYDKTRLEDQANNPNYNTAGNIVGLVGTGTGVTRLAAKAGLNVAGKTLAQAGSKLGYIKAAVGPVLTNAAIDGFIAGSQNEGKKSFGVLQEDKSSLDAGVENFLFSFGAQGLVKSGVLAGAALTSNAQAEFVKSTMKNLGGRARKATNEYMNYFKSKGVSDDVIIKEANETIEALGLNKADVAGDSVTIRQNYRNLQQSVGREISDAYEYIDRSTGNAPVDLSGAADSIKRILSPKVGGATSVAENNSKALQEVYADIFESDGTIKRRSLKGLWNLLEDANDESKSVWPSLTGNDRNQVLGSLRNTLSSYRKGFFEASERGSANIGAKALGIQSQISKLNADMSDLFSKRRSVIDQAAAQFPDNPQAFDAFIASEQQSLDVQIKALQAQINPLIKQGDDLAKLAQDMDPVEILAKNQSKPKMQSADGSLTLSEGINANEFFKVQRDLTKNSQKYERIIQFGKVIDQANVPETTEGLVGGFLKDLAARPFQTIATGVVFGQKAATGLAASRAAFSSVSRGMQQLSNETSDAATLRYANKMSRMFDNLVKSGDDTFLSRIGAQVMVDLQNQDISEEKLYSKLLAQESKVNMYLAPLPRTAQGAKDRIEEVINLAAETNPEIADVIANAIDMGDDDSLNSAMDSLSRQPELMRFFKAGRGWDGKLYDPAERQMEANSIKSDLLIPAIHKEQLVNRVMTTGEVPDRSQFQRQPRTYQPVDKNKPRN